MSLQGRYENSENDQGLFTNKSTMMANFEEWIKMATDNKINSRNSWSFALIDYFHDLNVLRDSENNISFRKASATLDGCVKIYSSRVDSVSSETGKLLSGLSQKKNQKGNGVDGESGEGGDAEDENEMRVDAATGLPIAIDTDARSRTRVYNRVLETTLVEFNSIKLKALDKELSIDPLFKKALVDFDEGGAKSLLLNTLTIDNNARVVFDAAIKDSSVIEIPLIFDDHDSAEHDDENSMAGIETENHLETSESGFADDEVLALGMDFIKFDDIVKCEISPSIEQLRTVVNDINQAKEFITGVNSRFGEFLTEAELKEAIQDGNDGDEQDNNDDNNVPMMDDMEDDMNNLHDEEDQGHNSFGQDDDAGETSMVIGELFEKDVMSYFDESLKKSWRGRNHWKVQNMKKKHALDDKSRDSSIPEESRNKDEDKDREENQEDKDTKKKKKKGEEIDFFAIDESLEETIFAPRQRKVIELPQKNRFDESHYLLPNDFQFSTERITRLFLKPKQRMSLFRHKKVQHSNDTDELQIPKYEEPPTDAPQLADEQFWADQYEKQEQQGDENFKEEVDIQEAVTANPFDDDEDIDFNQAFDNVESEKPDSAVTLKTENLRNLGLNQNKVTFSKVAKRVDVRKLKNNIWDSINLLISEYQNTDEATQIELKFQDITNRLSQMYGKETIKDLSTSFCFICLLHLCNEHGLSLRNTEKFEDLVVIKDIASKA